jgi:hypothetical protein
MQTYNKIPPYENIFILSNGQFKCGDQSDESRIKFFKNDYKKCVKCESNNINKSEHRAGCRWSGDGYGTDVFTCNECKWITSFQWDEAGDSAYYYETEYFK